MTTPTKFSDSQQQEAWRAYACAALTGFSMAGSRRVNNFFGNGSTTHVNIGEITKAVEITADIMMEKEMKRSRG